MGCFIYALTFANYNDYYRNHFLPHCIQYTNATIHIYIPVYLNIYVYHNIYIDHGLESYSDVKIFLILKPNRLQHVSLFH